MTALPQIKPDLAPDARRRVLMHVFPSFAHGGVPIRIGTAINRFGLRYAHRIVALDGRTDARSRLEPGLDVDFPDPPAVPAGLPWRLRALGRALAEAKPDLLLTYNWGSIEWALANRLYGVAPHIHFESGFGPEEATRQLPRRVWMRRLALAKIRALIVPSQTLVMIARDIWRLDPARILYIPNGIDCRRFAAVADPSLVPALSRRAGEVVIGTLAPLRAEKNIARLVRAFARLPDRIAARLLIVGDGPERARLEALAHEIGVADRTIFAGHVDEPEKVLGLFDVFAMSSDTEQMPNSLLQAMAAGLPVAAVDVGDVKAILAPENHAFVGPAGDDDSLAAALAALLADQTLRQRLGVANRAHVRATYDQSRMFEAYRRLFDA